jgi:hypothetical protein
MMIALTMTPIAIVPFVDLDFHSKSQEKPLKKQKPLSRACRRAKEKGFCLV